MGCFMLLTLHTAVMYNALLTAFWTSVSTNFGNTLLSEEFNYIFLSMYSVTKSKGV